MIQPEQRVARLDFELGQERRGRLVLDDHRDVLHLAAEPARDVAQRILHQPLERLAGHLVLRFRAGPAAVAGFFFAPGTPRVLLTTSRK